MHIDMKLNFMHILADLGFGGVYPIYWIKENKHATPYRLVHMHAKTFKNQTRYNLDKTPSKPTRHTQVWQENKLPKLYQSPKSTHDWRYYYEKIPNESKIPIDEHIIKE